MTRLNLGVKAVFNDFYRAMARLARVDQRGRTRKPRRRERDSDQACVIEPLEDRILLSDTQIVTPSATEFNLVPDSMFEFDLDYSTDDQSGVNPPASNELLTGLGFRLHFDSSALNFLGTGTDQDTDQFFVPSHPFATGDEVTYMDGGEDQLDNLDDGVNYFVIVDDANTIRLADSLANAQAGTAVNIRSEAGVGHTLTRVSDSAVVDLYSLLEVNLNASQVSMDVDNEDGDASTDMFFNVFWFDLGGEWPDRPLPLTLYHAFFEAANGFEGVTSINFTDSAVAAGHAFQSQSIMVNVDGTGPTVADTTPGNATVGGVNVDTITVTFADQSDLDEAAVENIANYTLIAGNGDGDLDDGDEIDLTSRIQSIDYDPMTKVATITLNPELDPTAQAGNPLFDDYRLTISNNIEDELGNALNGGVDEVIEFRIDTRAPVADIVDVTPDPRNTPAGVVTINFDQDVTGVDISDFALTLDTVPVDISGLAVTMVTASQYTVDLSTVTGAEGEYDFTLVSAGSGIQNMNSLALAGDASDMFTVDLTAPVASLTSPAPNLPNALTGTMIRIDFAEAIGMDPVSTQDTTNYMLVGDTVGARAIDSAVLTGNRVTLSLAALPDDNYTLTVVGSSTIFDLAGNALNGGADQTFDFEIDNTAPVPSVTPVAPDPRNTSVDTIFFGFDEIVNDVDLSDVSLSRDGQAVDISAATINDLGGGNFSISGLAAATTQDGDYNFTVDGTSGAITDVAGNSVMITAEDLFNVDMTGPTVVMTTPGDSSIGGLPVTTITVVFDDVNGLGVATVMDEDNYRIIAAGVDEMLGSGDDLIIHDGGANDNIASIDYVPGTKTATINLVNPLDPEAQPGMPEFEDYRVTLVGTDTIEDELGNALNDGADEVFEFRIDTRGPIPDVTDVAPDPRNTTVDEIDVVFNQPVNNVSIDDFTLTVNGGGNLLDGAVTITTADNETFTLGNLARLTDVEGDYVLSVNAVASDIVSQLNGLGPVVDAVDMWTLDITGPVATLTAPAEGSALQGPVGVLEVTYIEDIGLDQASVEDIANYSLRGSGPDNVLGTVDDIFPTITNIALAGNVATLTLNAALPDSLIYRLTVSGTATVTDGVGNPLNGGNDQSFEFEIDSTEPVAAIIGVAPDPRNTPVPEIEIAFDDVITGLDISDFTLTRDGGGNLLGAGQAVVGAGSDWVITGLTNITRDPGTYTLTLNAGGSGVADNAGNLLTMGDMDVWVKNDASTDAQTTTDTTPLITGIVDDIDATVQVTLTGEPLDTGGADRIFGPFNAVNNQDGTWSLQIGTALPNGRYDASLLITDDDGNTDAIDPAGFELTIFDQFEVNDTPGTAGVINTEGNPQTHSLHFMGDEDWTSFTIAEPLDMVITVIPGDGSATLVEVFDDADTVNPVAMASGAGTQEINIPLAAGTYFVRVSASGNTNVLTSYELSVASDPDLVVDFATDDLAADILAGAVDVDISNLKNVAVDPGTFVTASIIASLNDVLGDGDDMVIGSSLVSVAGLTTANSPFTRTVNGVDATLLTPGTTYNVFAQVDSNDVVEELDETNNNSMTQLFTAPIQFGDGFARNVRFTQPDGTNVNVTLNGGIGLVTLIGDNIDVDDRGRTLFLDSPGGVTLDQLRVDPTRSNGVLNVKSRGEVDLTSLLITGTFGRVNGKHLSVERDVNVEGGINHLQLYNIGSGGQNEVNIGFGANRMNFIANILNDVTFTSLTDVNLMRVASWLDSEATIDDVIEVDEIRRLVVQGFGRTAVGEFGADLNVDWLGSASLNANVVHAIWDIDSDTRNIQVRNTDNFSLWIDGELRTFRADAVVDTEIHVEDVIRNINVDSFDGDIVAAVLKTLRVTGARFGVPGNFTGTLTLSGLAGERYTLGNANISDFLINADWDITGDAKQIRAGGADGFDLDLFSSLNTLNIGDGNDIDVSVDGYVRQIRGDDWDNGSIVVDELRTLNFRDDFGADLWVGNPSGPVALYNARIGGGVFGSEWHLDGDAKSIVVGWADNWELDIDGTLKVLNARGDVDDSSIEADSANRLNFNDDLFDSIINLFDAGEPLRNFSVRDLMAGSSLRTWGDIYNARVGFLDGSNIFAGIDAGVNGLPNSGDIDALAEIRNLNIGGLEESNISAYELRNGRIGDIDPSGDGEPFGFALRMFNRLNYRVNGERFNLRGPGDAQVLPFDDDFRIRII